MGVSPARRPSTPPFPPISSDHPTAMASPTSTYTLTNNSPSDTTTAITSSSSSSPTTRIPSATTIPLAFANMLSRSPPPSHSPKPPRTCGTPFSLYSYYFSRAPPKPSPATNICTYCYKTGHWSNDCPLTCTICAQEKGKEARGHEAKDCRPLCLGCNGVGSVRRVEGDARSVAVLQLEAAVQGVKDAARRVRGEVDGGGGSGRLGREGFVSGPYNAAVRKDLQSHLDFVLMWANMAVEDLRKLVTPAETESVGQPHEGEDESRRNHTF
ncbi:hypothetical protein EJ02DRAFT_429925 [Clathrospora elynae]|uniref:CCHC-type domain-containing protein n=1 Tax=Clathrospora elynae TaxID=706981 RepID=A0A6A5T5P2_9PLEO|nr:hypothetical protein EJ02DRAFT_429925 [Clathrospora elynae]